MCDSANLAAAVTTGAFTETLSLADDALEVSVDAGALAFVTDH